MTTNKKPSSTFSIVSSNQKRRLFKKQFSQDLPDFGDPWLEQTYEISLNRNHKPSDRPPPLRMAWMEKRDSENFNEDVIIKKCKEVTRVVASGKLTRHASLEKDSILSCKKLLEGNEKPESVDKENEKSTLNTKPNLEIYLAHNTQIDFDPKQLEDSPVIEKHKPKYLQPLVTNMCQANQFQIKKQLRKPLLESPKGSTRPNTVVVVPLVEKDESNKHEEPGDGINVIIRPLTAQSKRDQFTKRTNSARQNSIKTPMNFRPPLIRSTSAPSMKSEKSKFLATKRKLKSSKKNAYGKTSSSKTTNEWKNVAAHSSDIVTMVSLVSSSGSENEESEDETNLRPKSALKKDGMENRVEEVSLRKTVKSVSFQQSSIYAVRSFSASFPARRGSLATAFTNDTGKCKTTALKNQEKRATNPNSPNAEERLPKKRLLKTNRDDNKSSSPWIKAAKRIEEIILKPEKDEEITASIRIDIQEKSLDPSLEASLRLDLEEGGVTESFEVRDQTNHDQQENDTKFEQTNETFKEKQCWAMYCKMTEKGINISYDTILRGMLTPTEYRNHRKTSIIEEPPSTCEETLNSSIKA
ncbi:hypothetical protein ABEB36_001523 [Hypothenemus hampei]|uniref:DUF4378 domain-containing protein n=1 Tax=Hypothenemus hampei TaxID=57062 RepID=A0ABD1FET9_HYPHA